MIRHRQRDCRRDDITDRSFILCGIIGGLPTYALYRYLPNTDDQQYQSSQLSFSFQDGWYNQPSSRPRSRLPQSDAHDSNDCVRQLRHRFPVPQLCPPHKRRGVRHGMYYSLYVVPPVLGADWCVRSDGVVCPIHARMAGAVTVCCGRVLRLC